MPTERDAATGKTPRKKNPERTKERSEVLQEFSESTADIIQKAASILEEEVAAGIVAARELERSMREGDDFRSDEFDDVMQRLRKDAHDMVNILGEQVNALRSGEFDDLTERFQQDAHDVVDLVLNVVGNAPQFIRRMRPPTPPEADDAS